MTRGDAARWGPLAEALAALAGGAVAGAPEHPVEGGCTNAAWRWRAGADAIFVKTGPAEVAPRFATEAGGLGALAAADAFRVPRVFGHGVAGADAWLALEWLELRPADARADAALGEALAALHRVQAPRFGWHEDNWIGGAPQANAPCDDWVEFLRERRLRPQLAAACASAEPGLAARLAERGERLLDALGVFYTSYRPVPSLLHGDLWSGNRAMLADGTPVAYDPAPYHGDREADLVLARLFGGFAPRFQAAYVATWPPDAAAGYRRDLHALYHLLNHQRLFGGGYGRDALARVDALLAEAGR